MKNYTYSHRLHLITGLLMAWTMVLLVPTQTHAQTQEVLRGYELYQAMGTPGFVSYEGSASIQWLPADLGYMEREQVDGGTL